MSNFDELFNRVENTEMINNLLSDDNFSKLRSGVAEALARDSKIILVTPYDKEKPLDTGMYCYDSAENALYVGAGDFQTMVNIIDFLNHNTSITYIPAPRVKTNISIEIPDLIFTTSNLFIEAPRVKTNNLVENVYETDVNFIVRKTIRNEYISNVNVEMIDLNCESEVNYG